mmetsp:Transcript_88051/g.284296  ORF Transcript_88051/g.284296 Transcript_88051/m.284296 type:complete len:411 (+) Transcript_88051:321-1553(+)
MGSSEDLSQEEGFHSKLFQEGAIMVTGDEEAYQEKELNRTVWEQFAHTDVPNVFGNLFIAEDGGFGEVEELWYKTRWVTALLTIGFIISNIYFIISVDMNILAGRPASGEAQDLESSEKQMFLLTHWLAVSVNLRIGNGADLIAIFELGGLTVLIASALHQFCLAYFARIERLKWFAAARLFWQIIPQLASYSSMRLLHHVAPTVFLTTVSTFASETQTMSLAVFIRKLVELTGFHAFCLFVGFDSFLVKIRSAYSAINDERLTFHNLYGALVFMVQVLGVIRLGTFVQNRLFVFIFAGEDSVMQPREKAKQHVWNALLARQIWRTFPAPKYFAIMLSFDDSDFQKLVLNEHQRARAPVGLSWTGDMSNLKAKLLSKTKTPFRRHRTASSGSEDEGRGASSGNDQPDACC